MGFLSWLESTAYAEWVLISIVGWPLMLASHSLGLATIVGVVIVVNLRLLGLYTGVPYTALRKFLPIAWVGFSINLITGFSLFMTQATSYISNGPFLTKMGFILIGTVNLVMTQKALKREGPSWDAAGTVTSSGRMLATSSLIFWGLAIMTGRLIAYL
jgi:hypothetical protein